MFRASESEVTPCGWVNAVKARLPSQSGRPLLLADWLKVLMVHYEVDPAMLRTVLPFPIDLFEGRAFVSLVFFEMRRMRPWLGGRTAAWLLRPIATHEFLNVRTYVEHNGEPGIFFLAEWLPNTWSVRLGPLLFGLPYRLGRLTYRHAASGRDLSGRVLDVRSGAELSYQGQRCGRSAFAPCVGGSLDEWLMERYTAYTYRRGVSRFFRVWHPAWAQARAEVEFGKVSLLETAWPWLADARLVGANYSPGFRDVGMGRPQRLAVCPWSGGSHEEHRQRLPIAARLRRFACR